ncbi:MAG TPA: ATP-binding protein [Mucilaginibacter sp.]|nr:ATP-binding protein [Mucilaginibacter sp.]
MSMRKDRIFLGSLSIQQRLPLLICFFLLSAITIYGFANYYSLRKATLTVGKVRLGRLANQISTMFGQSAQVVVTTMDTIAKQPSVKGCLQSGGREFRSETLAELDKLHRDTSWVSVTLLDSNLKVILRSEKSKTDVKVPVKEVLSFMKVAPNSAMVGKIYNVNGLMYYPAVATIADKDHIKGYIVGWQSLRVTPQAVSQFSHLLGVGAVLYIENSDASMWTDLLKPLPNPAFKAGQMGELIEYKDTHGVDLMASAKEVPFTHWVAVVEFPQTAILEGVGSFTNLIVISGFLLTIIGIIAAWVVSRNITKPLNELTKAATAISQGNYSSSVDIYRKDELGELANAFNTMTAKVYKMYQDLDNKVTERTTQLQNANKELEAFSYSVSHDLRTPLRAVNGYSIMLKEDYEDKLDAEGVRIINNIINNAKTMGQLIDELLAFSRLGKKELALAKVDMKPLVQTVIEELLDNEAREKYNIDIGALPASKADKSMIKQVLMNLVGNAIKYSSKRTDPLIEIRGQEEENRMVYSVKDNGVGFDMAYAGKLFGVFQRLHSQEEFEGTGVGLALVKRIIDKHGGEIWAEAEENKGATFYFSLPK